MSEEKKDRNKWVDAVVRMIELTQQGKMRWSVVHLENQETTASAVFETVYNGKGLRLYQNRIRVPNTGDYLRDMFPKEAFAPSFRQENILEFVDGVGITLWRFPQVEALSDLVQAAEYQVAGVNEFLHDLFSESNAAA